MEAEAYCVLRRYHAKLLEPLARLLISKTEATNFYLHTYIKDSAQLLHKLKQIKQLPRDRGNIQVARLPVPPKKIICSSRKSCHGTRYAQQHIRVGRRLLPSTAWHSHGYVRCMHSKIWQQTAAIFEIY